MPNSCTMHKCWRWHHWRCMELNKWIAAITSNATWAAILSMGGKENSTVINWLVEGQISHRPRIRSRLTQWTVIRRKKIWYVIKVNGFCVFFLLSAQPSTFYFGYLHVFALLYSWLNHQRQLLINILWKIHLKSNCNKCLRWRPYIVLASFCVRIL